MKDDPLYPYYICYLNDKLQENRLTDGSYALMKISGPAFEDFKYNLENDEIFNKKISEIYKSENRDKRIDDIFND